MLVVGQTDKLGLSHEVQVHKLILSRRGVMVCFSLVRVSNTR